MARQNFSPLLQRLQETYTCNRILPENLAEKTPLAQPAQPSPAHTMLRAVLDVPQQLLKKGRQSRKLVLLVVFVALLLDNMLLTVVVPIVPTYLYAIEFKGVNTSLYLGPTAASQHTLTPAFSTIFSFFDNNTISTEGSVPGGIAWTSGTSGTTPPPVTEAMPAHKNNCFQGTEFLKEENIWVGVLFASKALMQLLVNPFVGPLTNRYLSGCRVPRGAQGLRDKRMG